MKQFSKYLVVKSDKVSKDAYEKIKASLNATYKDLANAFTESTTEKGSKKSKKKAHIEVGTGQRINSMFAHMVGHNICTENLKKRKDLLTLFHRHYHKDSNNQHIMTLKIFTTNTYNTR